MQEAVYMKVTKDKYEYPLAIASSVDELAKLTGVHRTTIFRDIKKKGSGYVKVEINYKDDLTELEKSIVTMGADYFDRACEELARGGCTKEYKYLIGVSEGLRMALSALHSRKE